MKNSTCLLDTSALVAFLDRDDQHHRKMVKLLSDLPTPFKTCEAVLSETCFLLSCGGASNFNKQIFKMAELGFFEVSFAFKEAPGRIAQLIHQYRNLPMSFADACLVAMAEKYQEPKILTLDQDFKIYRWGKGRKFQVMGG